MYCQAALAIHAELDGVMRRVLERLNLSTEGMQPVPGDQPVMRSSHPAYVFGQTTRRKRVHKKKDSSAEEVETERAVEVKRIKEDTEDEGSDWSKLENDHSFGEADSGEDSEWTKVHAKPLR